LLNGLYQLREEKNWVADAPEELAHGRQLRAEASERRTSPDKRLLSEFIDSLIP
jgi:hypothetical protein